MSLPNKIILLLLLLVVFIAVCVYTKVDEIYSELMPLPAQVIVQTPSEEVQSEQLTQVVQTQEQVTAEMSPVESTPPPTDDQVQEQVTQSEQVPLPSEEELKKAQEATTQKEEVSLETQQNMEKIIEQNFEEEKKQNAEVSSNESVQEQINKLLVNNAIVFQRMSANIANESKETLQKIAKVIIDNPTIKIEIAGHTDSKGDDSFNQTVSEQRANSVKNALVELGIDANRLVAKGYGETVPLVPNDEEGYSLINRRVEFNIIEE
jgi:OmpA-OmpF porin, OOP family